MAVVEKVNKIKIRKPGNNTTEIRRYNDIIKVRQPNIIIKVLRYMVLNKYKKDNTGKKVYNMYKRVEDTYKLEIL